MDSCKNYQSPALDMIEVADSDILTASFNRDPDQNQGEWDKNEGDG